MLHVVGYIAIENGSWGNIPHLFFTPLVRPDFLGTLNWSLLTNGLVNVSHSVIREPGSDKYLRK
jgi:hypothetical protein